MTAPLLHVASRFPPPCLRIHPPILHIANNTHQSVTETRHDATAADWPTRRRRLLPSILLPITRSTGGEAGGGDAITRACICWDLFSPLLDTERIGFNLGQACSALRYRDAPLWTPSLLPSFVHDMLLPPNHPRRHKTEMSLSRFHNVTTCFLPQAQPTYTGRLGKWKKETNKHGNPSIPE